MIITFSDFTSITIALLATCVVLLLLLLAMVWRQSSKLKHQTDNNRINTQLKSIQQAIANVYDQIDKITLHTVSIKSNTHQAYQRATEMIQQDHNTDDIIAACKLSKGEIELLRALNVQTELPIV